MPDRTAIIIFRLALSLPLAACSTTPDTSLLDILGENKAVIGSPTELYTRFARGALTCWFGPQGPLKQDYVYHAEAEPPSKGGRSEIVIHVREKAATNPKGVRAFSVTVEPKGDAAELSVANLKMPEPLGQQLKTDVDRWAGGDLSCSDTGVAKWSPVDSNAPPAATLQPTGSSPAAARLKSR